MSRVVNGHRHNPVDSDCRAAASVEYRQIPDLPMYRFGSDGSVWSRFGTACGPGRSEVLPDWKRLKGHINRKGYVVLIITRGGVRKEAKVHRLILEAFRGPAPRGTEACHGNDIKSDNRIGNLRWGSATDNWRDRVANGRDATGPRSPKTKLSNKDVCSIQLLRFAGVRATAIAAHFGVSRSTVDDIYAGRARTRLVGIGA